MENLKDSTPNLFNIINLYTNQYKDIKAENNCLYFTLNDCIKICYNGKIHLDIPEHSIILFPAGSSYQIKSGNNTSLLNCSFNLYDYFTESLISNLLSMPHTDVLDYLKFRGRILDFLSLVSNYIQDNIKTDILHETLRKELFIILNLYYTKEELTRFLYPILSRDVIFKNFILKNCLNVETIDQLAQLANYSTSGFIKKFQRCFRESPYKWILHYKAKRILHEIQTSYSPFKEISEQYGFSSHAYFYTFCKKHYGFSPSEIRKKGKSILIKE